RSHDYFHKNKLVKSGSVSAIVLNTFPAIYEATVQRLKDMFTEQELKALLSTGENYNILPESLPVFYHRIMDAIKYFKMSEKYELEKETFLEKAQSLSLPEALIAEIWVSTFWSNYTGDIEEYIK
ncbi:hypothetical protein KA005_02345, partial [bacterium]|nr:hypothetical protein [bacterium]